MRRKALRPNAKATNGAGFPYPDGHGHFAHAGLANSETSGAYPEAKWHQWEPAAGDGAREGAKLAFGRNVNTVYVPGKANVIVSLDSDFLGSGPGHIAYAKQFARRRKLDGPNDTMNRLYVVEPTPSVTGSSADHRLPLRSSDVELFARALAGKLGIGSGAIAFRRSGKMAGCRRQGFAERARRFAGGCRRISTGGGACAGARDQRGSRQCWHNAVLHGTGGSEPLATSNRFAIFARIWTHGKVDLLLILGGNPVYDAPHDFDFVNKLKRVHHRDSPRARISTKLPPTANGTLPNRIILETWSDARAYDGTASIIQPLIAPLYYTRSAHDVLAAFSDKPGLPAYDAVRAYWTEASAHLGIFHRCRLAQVAERRRDSRNEIRADHRRN